MAVITKRKNNFKSKSSMKTKRSSKTKSNSKTRKQFKNIRKNGMGTRKMRGGGKIGKPSPPHSKEHSISRRQGKEIQKISKKPTNFFQSLFKKKTPNEKLGTLNAIKLMETKYGTEPEKFTRLIKGAYTPVNNKSEVFNTFKTVTERQKEYNNARTVIAKQAQKMETSELGAALIQRKMELEQM